jgi:hypothetical protein
MPELSEDRFQNRCAGLRCEWVAVVFVVSRLRTVSRRRTTAERQALVHVVIRGLFFCRKVLSVGHNGFRMPARQQFLFPPERPIVDRLGAQFFRTLPARAGVYKMHDAAGEIIYIGKARNLRQRLRSYRVANPETLSRRHLRLLQRVVRIEVELCDDESAALKHEATLIRSHKPKFNRAGVWPGKPQWLLWRCTENCVEMFVSEVQHEGWRAVAAFKWRAHRLRVVLARLLWLASGSNTFASMPCGWMNNRLPETVCVEFSRGVKLEPVLVHMFSTSTSELFVGWLGQRLRVSDSVFEAAAVAGDLEELEQLISAKKVASP